MHPSLISLLPSHPAALQSAGSRLCLSGPSCCGAKPLHVLQHTSPSILPTCRNLHVCARAVLLSVCTVQMDADWLLLFNSGWICFYGWACPGGTVVSCLWGRQAPGSLRAAAASQPSGTETEECRLYFQEAGACVLGYHGVYFFRFLLDFWTVSSLHKSALKSMTRSTKVESSNFG